MMAVTVLPLDGEGASPIGARQLFFLSSIRSRHRLGVVHETFGHVRAETKSGIEGRIGKSSQANQDRSNNQPIRSLNIVSHFSASDALLPASACYRRNTLIVRFFQ
jgi:hypothetical protein